MRFNKLILLFVSSISFGVYGNESLALSDIEMIEEAISNQQQITNSLSKQGNSNKLLSDSDLNSLNDVANNHQKITSSLFNGQENKLISLEDQQCIKEAALNQQQISLHALNKASKKSNVIKEQHNLFVFVSFSMPDISLKQWLNQASKLQARVILRGFKDNSLKESIKKITSITKNSNTRGFEINPDLFKVFNIKRVPAVVLTEKCYARDVFSRKIEYDIVRGNVGLYKSLQHIQGSGERTTFAKKILEDATNL